jgi:diaminohydroxyphosphoribosylaminopyrimidine deaminase/5-amino-6-(5-phosphoribosylamino)uracil reductase
MSGSSVLTHELAWELACEGPFPDPGTLTGDEAYMALALRKGMGGVGLSSPNPPVACILVRDGRVIGQGVHTRAGDPHGEILALRDAERRDESTQGATAYVTLEPCCHTGRTPPCTDALIRSGIRRVVVGVSDPNPRVDGGGLAILQAHGLEVVEGVLGEACARFHAPFFKYIRTGLPWVMLKLAVGSDGGLGPDGQCTQVTSPEIQALAHALRRACDAVIVGRGTVAIDDPQLTDRWPEATPVHRRFHRVVLDSHGSLPPKARVWQPVSGQPSLRVVTEDLSPLRHVEDLHLPPGPGGCSLRHLLHELAAMGMGRVLFEGGGQLARRLLDQGLVDVFHRFQSSKPVGGSPALLDLDPSMHIRTDIAFDGGHWQVIAESHRQHT